MGEAGLTIIEQTPLTYLLPYPLKEGSISVEKAISRRRSHRSYASSAISAEQISQILWAAYGMSGVDLRTAPSAGALYPLELYLLAGNVLDIEPGVYKYNPPGHKIIRVIYRDIKSELSMAAFNQLMINTSPACLVYCAVYSRSTRRYGDRGFERYVCMDLGHSAQNVYLQTEAMGLGTCAVGAFNDLEVKTIMQLPEDEDPLYLMPIGKYHPISEY